MHKAPFPPFLRNGLSSRAPRPSTAIAPRCFLLAGAAVCCALALTGCGSGLSSPTQSVASSGHLAMQGTVHGGQQPVIAAKVYLYAVSTTANGGAAASLLTTPGYVLTDLNGGFSITTDYSCPAGAYVYLLALGGNPGILTGNNPDLALAAGLGACSSLSASTQVVIDEITTVAFAYVISPYATTETQIGGTSSGALGPNFGELPTFVDLASGTALATNTGNGTALQQSKIDSLANSIASCVNSDGSGAPCSTLMSLTGVNAASQPVDTFQAALNIAQNPSANVAAIYDLGSATGPFQPSLSAPPADWSSPVTTIGPDDNMYVLPAFFNGEVSQGNGTYYLSFPNGEYFGYYSFLADPRNIQHEDLGEEFITDAGDGLSGIYMYDYTSGHTWYTSPTYSFPYLYDYSLKTVLYYYPDPNNAGHYNTNGVRYFYDYNTGTVISF